MAGILGIMKGMGVKKRNVPFISLLFILTSIPVIGAYSPFAIVAVDARTIAAIGDVPFSNRTPFVTAMRNLRAASPKAVVVKFFLDLPGNADTDAALAKEMKAVPTFLQAAVNTGEKKPNPFDRKAIYTNIQGHVHTIIEGRSGWLPLPEHAAVCQTYGFVDYRGNPEYLPAIEQYNGHIVRSLWLALAEYMFGQSEIVAGRELRINGKRLPLTDHQEVRISFPEKDALDALSFVSILSNTFPASRIRDRIVIICYDGEKIGRVNTPVGLITVHRLFYYGMASLYEQIR
ncbi:MAG: CHASE2 domain-containing protein [Spirochaetota bacterium]